MALQDLVDLNSAAMLEHSKSGELPCKYFATTTGDLSTRLAAHLPQSDLRHADAYLPRTAQPCLTMLASETVSLSGTPLPFGQQPRTITHWFHVSEDPSYSRITFYQYVFGSTPGTGMYLRINPANGVHLNLVGAMVGFLPPKWNEWMFIAVRVPSGTLWCSDVELFVDGMRATPSESAYITAFDTASPVTLTMPADSGSTVVKQICDFRVYDRALTDDEIKLAMQNEPVGSPVNWWKMNEGTGTTLIDSGWGANNRPLAGAATPWVNTQTVYSPRQIDPASDRWALTQGGANKVWDAR